jgi:putative ATP-dependent endonuclease of OLD family
MENLRGVYLPPLRDASLGLRPSRFSQVARLFQLLTDESGRDGINQALKRLDDELKRQAPIVSTSDAIVLRHKEMLGDQLAQMIDLGLSSGDFRRLASRLSISVDGLDVDQNGLGYNNLIYMAVVLSELSKSPEASYRSLLVEEPEAHLHPQLQAVLLRYLERIHAVKGERPVQIFVTSHSPNFASIADVSCLTCMVDVGGRIDVFSPRKVNIDKRKLDKLKRYLDVTRAELFFARRVIFVEGAAELMLVGVLAKNSGFDLRAYGVSLISVEGLNFDSFMPLFGEHALRIPVSVITDADPGGDDDDLRYPSVNDNVKVSDNAAKMKAMEDSFVRVFYGVKTLEYDLALYQENRNAMLGVLYDMHPKIARQIEDELETVSSDAEAARVMFSGMFERKSNNVQKGRFAQSLAQRFVEQPAECRVPDYIVNAVRHVCQAAGCG